MSYVVDAAAREYYNEKWFEQLYYEGVVDNYKDFLNGFGW